MEHFRSPIDLIALLYLFQLAGRFAAVYRRRQLRLSAAPLPPAPRGSGPVPLLVLAFTAGLGLAWSARQEPIALTALTGAAIAAAAALSLLVRAGKRNVRPEALALLDRLAEATSAGAGFFAALASAGEDLAEGPVRRAVDASVSGYARREPLRDCVRPLAAADPALAGLASDVRRTGPEASPILAEAVGLVRAAAVRRWDRERGSRIRLDRLEDRLPGIRFFAAGAAVWTAFGGATAPSLAAYEGAAVAPAPASWQLTGGLAILGLALYVLPAYFGRIPRARRLALAGGGLAAAFLVLPAAIQTSVLEVGTAAAYEPAAFPGIADRLMEPPPDANPVFEPITDPTWDRQRLERSAICRIETGVPGGSVNLRERPGMESRVAHYIADGELLEILAEAGDFAAGMWLRVRAEDGRSGWVYAPLCVGIDG